MRNLDIFNSATTSEILLRASGAEARCRGLVRVPTTKRWKIASASGCWIASNHFGCTGRSTAFVWTLKAGSIFQECDGDQQEGERTVASNERVGGEMVSIVKY